MIKRLFTLALGAAMILASSAFTSSEPKDIPTVKTSTEPLVLYLKPNQTILAFATVEQVQVMTVSEANRCVCQGYCRFATEPPHYGQWVRECVQGTTPIYLYGVGTQFYCAYCPPPIC